MCVVENRRRRRKQAFILSKNKDAAKAGIAKLQTEN